MIWTIPAASKLIRIRCEGLMKKDWTIREELYKTFHQWPSMIAFFLLGCLLGWIAYFVWPPKYQATAQISVGLNPYRTFSDTAFLALAKPKFRNLDDYKNWQMSQLETIIFINQFIDPTLDQLRKEDSYWQAIDRDELRSMLSVGWRTTGLWDLKAEHSEALRATQAAEAWSKVTIDKVKSAIQAARNTFMIDQERQEIIKTRLEAQHRVEALKATKATLQEWEKSVQNADPDQPLTYQEREEIIAQVAQIADFTPSWLEILNSFPEQKAPTSAYLGWLASTFPSIDSEISFLETQSAGLSNQEIELQAEYDKAANANLGLSPNIAIEEVEYLPAESTYTSSQFILIGGLMGFFVWIFAQLIRVGRKEYIQ